ncbi:MAG: methyltransferase domain-containing protein [Flavobacteriales bacterium]|jgi:SAM-dependent methyltransferase|nr:MAG: methyltransferase domain-containing protein [Flavobacteriales bacterium]
MGWFKHWFGTPYYKLLYGHRDDADAQAWVEAILGRWRLPEGAGLLDLACGRGRHARHFAAHGIKVTGCDLSEESIAEARAAVPQAEFLVHDMREPIAGRRFEAICCLFTSLGYFERLEDDQRVLDAVAAMLVPGGGFVLDFMNTDVVLRDLVPHEEVERGGVRFRITRCLQADVLVKRIEVLDGEAVHRFEERVQTLRPAVLEGMATGAGLRIEDRTDGPLLTPFDPDRSPRFVLWCRKPPA